MIFGLFVFWRTRYRPCETKISTSVVTQEVGKGSGCAESLYLLVAKTDDDVILLVVRLLCPATFPLPWLDAVNPVTSTPSFSVYRYVLPGKGVQEVFYSGPTIAVLVQEKKASTTTVVTKLPRKDRRKKKHAESCPAVQEIMPGQSTR